MDADLIGLTEIDSVNGEHPEAVIMLFEMMKDLGYSL